MQHLSGSPHPRLRCNLLVGNWGSIVYSEAMKNKIKSFSVAVYLDACGFSGLSGYSGFFAGVHCFDI